MSEENFKHLEITLTNQNCIYEQMKVDWTVFIPASIPPWIFWLSTC